MKHVYMFCSLLISAAALATPGQFLINADCAAVGCFPGDNPATQTIEITGTSGTYVLTGPLLTSDQGNPVIAITPPANRAHITVDLNGYEIRHTGVASGSTNGIEINGNNATVTIRNGKIAAFNDNIRANANTTVIIEHMTLRIARDDAVQAEAGIIRNNVFDSNEYGIHAANAGGNGDRLMITGNVFIEDDPNNPQNVEFGMADTNYCRDNLVAYAEGGNDFASCTLIGGNWCDDGPCVSSAVPDQTNGKQ